MTIEITPTLTTELTWWHQLYEQAFPAVERLPWNQLQELAQTDSRMQLQTIKSDQRPVGILFGVQFAVQECFVVYLAISPEERGQNLGSQVVQQLKQVFPQGLMLESELVEKSAPNFEQRQRRYAFYLRNGLQDSQLMTVNGPERYHLLYHHHYDVRVYLQISQQLGLPMGIYLSNSN
ncbi:GNAT family N-acetyltransferase [Lactobacillus sp. DCY120]|uniref:GNAT family N-acetyltransferase n=1 Tax=Bombilactobacillus apium TaxID=2675299 RepID=A0A850RCE8_9LACO|nr:GNAT family N-acetyltransferase [Bombilactobacillus apium]NVY96448.1 GNAT family N-acetyltransferase [Bombilactobacillus apium]